MRQLELNLNQTKQEQSSMDKKNYYFSKYPLYANETPVFRQVPNSVYIPNGKNNDYPDYLIYLYNTSGIHSAIVKGKSRYIFGKGFNIKKDWQGDRVKLQSVLNSINSTQTSEELTKRAIFERTLFGGKYYLIDWNINGTPKSVKILPYNSVRTNENRTEFYYSENWTREQSVKSKYKKSLGKMPDDAKTYPALNILSRKGQQVLFISDYNPASEIYPLPEYQPCTTAIETEIECGFFHLNNVKTGFAAGTMITLFNGIPENEEAEAEVEYGLKSKTSGTDNAGEVIVNFQQQNSQAPSITPLRSNELDKQYEQLSKDTINKIFYGHTVNPILFGIKTEGQLGGGRSDFDLAWEQFLNTYVKPKQQEEEEDFNYILSLYGIAGNPVELVVLDPIGIELTSDTIMSVLTLEEKRKLVLEKLGLENEPTPQAKFRKFANEMLIEKFKSIGESAELFEEVYDCGAYLEFADGDTEKIKSQLIDNPKISVSELSKITGIDEKTIYKILDKLNSSNQLAVKYIERNGQIIIDVENIEPQTVALESKWKYSGPKDSKNREFCAQLLSMNKLYTRAEIDSLSNDMDGFNTDVWKYKGGWYHDPDRDVNVPQCRHYWQSIIVKRK